MVRGEPHDVGMRLGEMAIRAVNVLEPRGGGDVFVIAGRAFPPHPVAGLPTQGVDDERKSDGSAVGGHRRFGPRDEVIRVDVGR